MLEDTFDSLDEDDMEEEAQEAVDKILFEITQGVFIVCITTGNIPPVETYKTAANTFCD